MNIKSLSSLLFACIVFSCAGKSKKEQPLSKADEIISAKDPPVSDYAGKEAGDSIFYYRDFDLYSFKGTNRQSADNLQYPFIKMVYRNDSLFLKVYYNSSNIAGRSFFKLNRHWCTHLSHWGDGVTSHFYTIHTDSALYEFRFLRNPYGTTPEDKDKPAKLYSVTVTSKRNAVPVSRYYKGYDWGDADSPVVPKIKAESELGWLNNCSEFINTRIEIKEGNIISTSQSYEREYIDGTYKDLKRVREFVTQQPLRYNSEFYTTFKKFF